MMYSVFLVDDEEWGLSALEASFRWEAYGFRVVQRLTRPQQALQAILLESRMWSLQISACLG